MSESSFTANAAASAPGAGAEASRVTLETLRQMKQRGEKIAMLTCYDFYTAQALAAAGIPALLVGDSAAMVVLGRDATTFATVDLLTAFCAAVRRGAPQAFLMADMPFGSYADVPMAVANALRFMQQGGADALKLECDARHVPVVAALATAGISVCAHLGLLPQRAVAEGGYKARGRTLGQAEQIVQQARELVAAGAAMVLLEAVPNEVSVAVQAAVRCPVIGCGAGPACDGHVVVLHDLLGYNPHPPRFVEPLADVPAEIRRAATAYRQSISTGEYPAQRHTYSMKR